MQTKNKCVKTKNEENILKIKNELMEQLTTVELGLLEVKDVEGHVIPRSLDIAYKVRSIKDELELLLHDLRDDYGTGYKITKGE